MRRPRVLKPRGVISTLEAPGFAEVRQRGSHKQFRHPDRRGVFSPDGERIAYSRNVYRPKPGRMEVRLINVDGTGDRVLYHHDKATHAFPWAWYPDGKSLLACMGIEYETGELWRIPVDGGEPEKWPLPFLPFGVDVHPDGRRVGLTAFSRVDKVWALENFLPGGK